MAIRPLLSLNRYLWRYRGYLLTGTVFIIISNVFALLPAQVVRYSFDLVEETILLYRLAGGLPLQDQVREAFTRSLILYGAVILGMALLRGIFLFLMRQTIIVMSRLVEFDQKNDIYAQYQRLPAAFYRQATTGDLMARISEDVSRVRMYTGPAIMYGINMVVLLVMVLGYMISVSPRLTLWTMLPLPVLSVTIYLVNDRIARRSEEIQAQLSELSRFVQEAFSGIRVIKAFNREGDFSQRFTEASGEYRERSLGLARVNALFFPAMLGLIGLSTIIAVYVGGLEVAAGRITTGVIAEFIIYVSMLTWPVTSLGWITSIAQRAATSQRRIDEFLDIVPDIDPGQGHAGPMEGRVTFENVTLRYPDDEGKGAPALTAINLDLAPGERVLVLGPTGSGKSTLVSLVPRLFDATGGRVLVDGRDVREWSTESLRGQIVFVSQVSFLFSDTIGGNLRFGAPEAGPETLEAAAKTAALLDSVKSFEKGFETVVGERGVTLSGGQRQRTSLARALLKGGRVVILDDALSAVDTHTESEILNNLAQELEGRTCLIVSHRVSAGRLADRIIYLDGGRIVEEGTHTELMARRGPYAELYDQQMSQQPA